MAQFFPSNYVKFTRCTFTSSDVCLQLSGNFDISENTFKGNLDRCIDIFYHRGNSSISSNTFASGQYNNVVKLTKKSSDTDSNKGGTLPIDSNIVNYSGTTCAFVFNDCYNQYLAISSDNNLNTKLSLDVANDTINSINGLSKLVKFGKLVESQRSMDCFIVNINSNIVSVSNYRALHLNKQVNDNIINLDISLSIFKISNNTINSIDAAL